ncbi:MAG: hypothetical protein JKY20_11220 [Alphaproteobacteria bacterium]|nr:hypothetical protein [Alphaproteobacteria bacterium]
MIETIMDRVNKNAGLVRRGRYVTLDFLVGIGDVDYIFRIDRGRIESVTPRTKAMVTGHFSIRAADDVWAEFWKPMPRRDYHDLFSMFAAGRAQLDGDVTPFMQNIRYFKDVLAAPRPVANKPRPVTKKEG